MMSTIPASPSVKACTATLILFIVLLFQGVSRGANITAFGDSITEGDGSDTGGYPPKLESLLNSNGKPSVVVNKGVGGEQTHQGLKRFDEVLVSFPSNIVLIMEGTNDVSVGISLETTKFNLQEMINKTKAAQRTPVLATLTPSNKGESSTLIPQYWNPMITALAASNNIKLADQYKAVQPSWDVANSDGLHPNDIGYQLIATTWYNAIAPMISATGEVSTGGGGGGGGCFIATAAFGSAMERHVLLLKEFRDTCLLTNSPGRTLVEAYYHYSPPAADFISRHENLRLAVRIFLYPLILFCYVLLKLSLPLQVLLAGITTVGALLLATRALRRGVA